MKNRDSRTSLCQPLKDFGYYYGITTIRIDPIKIYDGFIVVDNKIKQCPFCGEGIQDAAIKCKHCKSDLSRPSSQPLTVDYRGKDNNQNNKSILNSELLQYTSNGYVVEVMNDYSAQLRKHEKFSWCWAFFWLCITMGPGIIAYLIYYVFIKKEKTLFIAIDSNGVVQKSE